MIIGIGCVNTYYQSGCPDQLIARSPWVIVVPGSSNFARITVWMPIKLIPAPKSKRALLQAMDAPKNIKKNWQKQDLSGRRQKCEASLDKKHDNIYELVGRYLKHF